MDYVEALATWCVRRGLDLPTYRDAPGLTVCSFFGKDYQVLIRGRQGQQDAAQEAYEKSGIFGKIIQSGFVPVVRRDKEIIVDLLHGPPSAATDALLAISPNVQVSMFAPFNDTTTIPDTEGSYTIYSTVHPGEEAFWARLEWYVQLRLPTWQRYDTEVHIYTSVRYGEYVKELLELAGVRVVLC
jgi:hypothetical protein